MRRLHQLTNSMQTDLQADMLHADKHSCRHSICKVNSLSLGACITSVVAELYKEKYTPARALIIAVTRHIVAASVRAVNADIVLEHIT